MQRAYQKNCYNLLAADLLISDFSEKQNYSTALYYALQIEKYDKKKRFTDTDYRIANLYFLLDYPQESMIYYKKAKESFMKSNKHPELLNNINQRINDLSKINK